MTGQNKVQWVYSASDNNELAKRYDQWASTYDQDLEQDFDWIGHLCAVKVFIKFVTPDSTVIDVGCGTGLAGSELKVQGFTHIDGFDMSQGMLQQARLLDIYGDLKINILGETLDYPTAVSYTHLTLPPTPYV